jgi:hypothetical protein
MCTLWEEGVGGKRAGVGRTLARGSARSMGAFRKLLLRHDQLCRS